MRVSSRGEVDPFIVMDVMEAAAQAEAEGRHIVHMEVGQPSTPAPAAARAALIRAMQADPLGYTVALGLPELRERIARLYGEWYDIDLNPDRVVITNGSTGGFVLAFASLFDPGGKVGIGIPGYPAYTAILKSMALDPVLIEAATQNRLQPVPEDLPDDIDGLLVASPGNPSGTMLDRDALAAVIAATQEKGAAFISDEIYHGLEYEQKAVSALEITDEVYVINSFSKYFSMTGWRIGWMVVPEAHVRRVERLQQNMFICAPHASQVLALHAMDCADELDANMDVYRTNHAMMLERLPQAGFTNIAPPDGAFYVYADVSDVTQDSRAFAREMLDTAGVAATPGLDFDPIRGNRMLRFSYAAATEEIEEGLDRLARFMAAR